jgi:hypothetical protein
MEWKTWFFFLAPEEFYEPIYAAKKPGKKRLVADGLYLLSVTVLNCNACRIPVRLRVES